MSFHGGFAGTTLAMILFARSRGISIWTLFDVVAAGVPVALGLVRCANFVNSELWGRVTDVPWAVVFPTGGPVPASSEPDLRSRLGGPCAVHRATPSDPCLPEAEGARLRRRRLRDRLRPVAHLRRVLP